MGFNVNVFCLCSFQEPQEEDDDEEDEEDEEQEAPNPPMMVPMADMLNHVSNHNANLEFTPVGGDASTPLFLTSIVSSSF